MRGIHIKTQDAQTTGNGTAYQLDSRCRNLTFYIRGTGTVSAGAVQIEHAHDKDYTGTWQPIGTPITVVSGEVDAVQLTGAFGAVRSRISTNIAGGGSVTVDLFGNSGE